MRKGFYLLISLFFAGFLSGLQAGIIYVKNPSDSPNAWQGKSPVYTTIGGAINASHQGDEIWVARGRYTENVELRNGISLYGGFLGSENSLNDRTNVINEISPTIIDGSQNGRCILASSNNLIDGFKLENGNELMGAGINVWEATNVHIRNVAITNCKASWLGGGIYVQSTNQTGTIIIENVSIWECTAYCGALEIDVLTSPRVIVRQCTIFNNHAYGLEIPYYEGHIPANNFHDFYNNIIWQNTNERQPSYFSEVWAWARNYTDYSYIGHRSWPPIRDKWDEALPNNIFEDYIGNPGFVDAINNDFHLLDNSSCIAKGRNGTDMGAFYSKLATKPTLSVFSTNINFGYAASTLSFNITNIGPGKLTWSLEKHEKWITNISPKSGSLGPGKTQKVTVTVDRVDLATGLYHDYIKITSNGGEEDVTAKMYIGTEPTSIVANPEILLFTTTETGKTPSPQSVIVTNAISQPLSWSVSEPSEYTWMTLSNTSGNSGGHFQVAVDVTGLQAGIYSGKVRISAPHAANDPFDVQVLLIVAQDPDGAILAEMEAEGAQALPNSGWETVSEANQNAVKAAVREVNSPNDKYRLDYTFNVPKGIDKVYIFGEVNVDGQPNQDSFWFTVNNGDTCVWNNLYELGDGWKRCWLYNFDIDTMHTFAVHEGENTMSIFPREKNAMINWLVVTTNPKLDIQNHKFGGKIPAGIENSPHYPDGVHVFPPDYVSLSPNYPNPFNPVTNIMFSVNQRSLISLAIYNELGQWVKNLVQAEYQPGEYQLNWDGTDQQGIRVQSGRYYAVLKTDSQRKVIKMTLVK
ncbi:DUF1565 domain-containing protein [candidate division KSB1 bacterium]|nr:DUF1565 domain-containing protein [candidate division KSB1 bacterium]